MEDRNYDRLHNEVVDRMKHLPDILPCGPVEIWLDRSQWESAVTEDLAARWTGKGLPPKKWIDDNFDDALHDVCSTLWSPG